MALITTTFSGLLSADQTFIVPTGVTSLTVTCRGSAGRNAAGVGSQGQISVGGGRGAIWSGTITVTPLETLTIQVGNNLAAGVLDGSGRGRYSYPDGGRGGAILGSPGLVGAPAGGSSRIWRGGVGGSLLVCAGAGGGAAIYLNAASASARGGDAGLPTGASAGPNALVPSTGTAVGGGGATTSSGGSAGNPGSDQAPLAGSFLTGGYGGARTASSFADYIIGGGGGGGGYYGGGGGGVVGLETALPIPFSDSAGAGGGGGSSYAEPSITTTTSWTQAAFDAIGEIVIVYNDVPPDTTPPDLTGTALGWFLGLVMGVPVPSSAGALSLPYLLYDIRHWTSGALVNEGSLGSFFNLPLDFTGTWDAFFSAYAPGMANFGGVPSFAPITFMFKASSTLVKAQSAYGNIQFYQASSGFTKFIEGEANLNASTAFVQGDSSTGSATNDMNVVFSQATPSPLFAGSLFFITLNFAAPTTPTGLDLWRNGTDQIGAPQISALHYGVVATTAYIDALFSSSINMYIEFTSANAANRGLTAMAMFRGTPNATDLATWAAYF